MESVLVHLYQIEKDCVTSQQTEIIGYVEFIENKDNQPFKNRDELWSILMSHIGNTEKEVSYAGKS